MWIVLLLVILIHPVQAQGQHVGDLSPNPNSNTLIGNPFNSGGSWSVKVPGATGGRTAPTNPYAWSNILPPTDIRPMLDRAGELESPARVAPIIPNRSTSRVGPYGLTLPPNHPLGLTTR